MNRKRAMRWAPLLLGLLLLANGCSEGKSIDSRSMIFELGFDTGSESSPTVTAEEINPLSAPAAASAVGGGGGSAGSGPPVVFFEGSAPTVSGAFQTMQRASPKFIDLTDVGAIVFSASLAKKSLMSPLSYLTRASRVRQLAWVLVSEGSAAGVVRTQPKTTAGSSFRDLFIAQGGLGAEGPEFVSERLWELQRDTLNREQDAVLPLIKVEGGQIVFDGSALFHEGKMTGQLSAQETGVLQTLAKGMPYALIVVPAPGGDQAVLRVISAKPTISLRPGPSLDIEVSLVADLVELPGVYGTPPNTTELAIEEAADRTVTEQIEEVYRHLQAANCDALGIGKLMRATQTREWDRLYEQWPSGMRDIPLTVHVKVSIESTET